MTGPVSLDAPLGTPTDWSRYDVPSLWAMASMEDSSDSWTQVWAWWRCRDALDAYRRHLTACRDGLAAKWPPERSPAAAAFLGRVDTMIHDVSKTADAAGSTAAGLAGIINALDDAKHQLAPLHAQWQANEQAEAAAPWSVAGWGPASPRVSGLPDGWRDQLNRQARSIVAEAERAVFDRTQQLTPAPARSNDFLRLPDVGGTSPGGGHNPLRPPVIPPLADPTPIPGDTGVLTGNRTTGPPGVPAVPGSSPASGQPAAPDPGRSWFVSTPVGRVMARGGVIGGPAPDVGSDVPPDRRTLSPGRVPGGGGSSPGEPGRVIGASRTPPDRAVPPPDADAPRRPPLGERPPMNVIGGSYLPASGVMPGRGESERPAGRRVNPVGGVIGGTRSEPGGETYTTASGHTVSVSDPRSGSGAGRPGGRVRRPTRRTRGARRRASSRSSRPVRSLTTTRDRV